MNNFFCEGNQVIKMLANSKVKAIAKMQGRDSYNKIYGEVCFYDFDGETAVVCVFHNLPQTQSNFFGLHIHENGSCEGDFSSAGGHFGEGEHPCHKGDLPVVLNANGNAFLAFCTDRFSLHEVIGKSVVLHLMPDNYRSQPSGDSGERIACGVITVTNNH